MHELMTAFVLSDNVKQMGKVPGTVAPVLQHGLDSSWRRTMIFGCIKTEYGKAFVRRSRKKGRKVMSMKYMIRHETLATLEEP